MSVETRKRVEIEWTWDGGGQWRAERLGTYVGYVEVNVDGRFKVRHVRPAPLASYWVSSSPWEDLVPFASLRDAKMALARAELDK